MHSGKIQLSLIENAKDFLADTIERALSDEQSSWKYAIISLASAIELIVKAILQREHWSLLFEDVDSASQEHLKSGDFKSVDSETGLVRLDRIAKVKLSASDKKCLSSIRNTRNRILHGKTDLNIEQVKSIVARGIPVFLELYKGPHLREDHDETYEASVNKSLRSFDKYVRVRMACLRPQIQSASRPEGFFRYCQTCDQDAVIYNREADDEAQCLFCGEVARIEELAARHSELPVEECPECGRDALAFVLYNNDEGEFICGACGFKAGSIDHCWECGSSFVPEEGEVLCDDCLSYKLAKD